jgi:hypothetical protein
VRDRSETAEPEETTDTSIRDDANYIIERAEQMLALDLTLVPLARETQFIVGWMRGAFDQSRAIATLTRLGMADTAAPNRRSFAEIALRLLWLRNLDAKMRAAALDAMIADEKRLTTNFYDTLKQMGFDHDVDLSEMETIIAHAIEDKDIAQQIKAVTTAAKAAPQTIGLYSAWREETQYTHATAHLASAYAPEDPAGVLGSGRPPTELAGLDSHYMVCVLVATLAFELLREAGVDEEVAWPIVSTGWNAR